MTHPREFTALANEIAEHAVGLQIRDMRRYQMLEFVTESNNRYSLVVIDPARALVAVRDERKYLEPEIFVLQGSTCDSATLHVGRIDLGRELELTQPFGLRVTTSTIRSLKPIEDENLVYDIVTRALRDSFH